MNHFLVYTEGYYEEGTIHGIFNELNNAKEFVENNFSSGSIMMPEIQEWNNTEQLNTFILKGSFNWVEGKY